MTKVLTLLIQWYQKTGAHYLKSLFLLPNTGCRYYPTCSEYTKRSIEKYGYFKGAAKGIWRLIRCNPFSPGGFDYP